MAKTVMSTKGKHSVGRNKSAKFYKRQLAKLERRTAKRLLDDAPVKRMVSGWTW